MPAANTTEQALADDAVAHQLRLSRVVSGYSRRARAALSDLVVVLADMVQRTDPASLSKARLDRLLEQAQTAIEDGYTPLAGLVDFRALGNTEAAFVAGGLAPLAEAAGLAVNLLPASAANAVASAALIEGAPSAAWWARQAADTAFRFASLVRGGVVAGLTNQELVQQVRGGRAGSELLNLAHKNADALVRSSVMVAARDVRLAAYREASDLVLGVRQVSTLDSRTSLTCVAYADASWNLEGTPIRGTRLAFNGGPPRHWGCRSTLAPILTPSLLQFSSTRASDQGQVGATSFAAWLARQPATRADELLGEGRAQLWLDGRITLQQLLDTSGRPMTLDKLQELYA